MKSRSASQPTHRRTECSRAIRGRRGKRFASRAKSSLAASTSPPGIAQPSPRPGSRRAIFSSQGSRFGVAARERTSALWLLAHPDPVTFERARHVDELRQIKRLDQERIRPKFIRPVYVSNRVWARQYDDSERPQFGILANPPYPLDA